MLYRVAAELLVLVHLGFIVFVIAGGLTAFKWPWMAFVHLPAALWGAIIEYRGWICPLTPWENQLRQFAGQDGYAEGFIEHYLLQIVYPPGLTREMQIMLGTAVVVINLIVYGALLYRWLRN